MTTVSPSQIAIGIIIIPVNDANAEPFLVAFVETVYTVDESVGAVNVCVNLTRQEIDILDETVNVFVMDYSSSFNISAGTPLASKPNYAAV